MRNKQLISAIGIVLASLIGLLLVGAIVSQMPMIPILML